MAPKYKACVCVWGASKKPRGFWKQAGSNHILLDDSGGRRGRFLVSLGVCPGALAMGWDR